MFDLLLAGVGCETGNRVLIVGFMRNNNVATNLQNVGSKYGKRRFAARLPVCLCNFWLFSTLCIFLFLKNVFGFF